LARCRTYHQSIIPLGASSASGSNPLLSEHRLNLAHFHLSYVATKLDSGCGHRRLKLFGLRFEFRLIFVTPHPDKFVLRPIHPGPRDGHADFLVQAYDVLFEVLEKIIHLAFIDRVNANL
jgi:hypothetical protein